MEGLYFSRGISLPLLSLIPCPQYHDDLRYLLLDIFRITCNPLPIKTRRSAPNRTEICCKFKAKLASSHTMTIESADSVQSKKQYSQCPITNDCISPPETLYPNKNGSGMSGGINCKNTFAETSRKR